MKKFKKQMFGGILGTALALFMSTSIFASVSVKVTGDTNHMPNMHKEYSTWLETDIDFKEGAKAEYYMQTALNTARMQYDYSYGYLSSVTSQKGVKLPGTNATSYAGWMYYVNGGSPAVGMAEYDVKDNDSIEIAYTDDYRELYGYGLSVISNEENVTFKVYSADGTEMTDSGWGYSLMPGSYTYTAEKEGFYPVKGSFSVTNDDVSVNIDMVKEGHSLVKVIGDSVHGTEEHTEYVTWISSQQASKEGQTAADVLFAALEGAGYKYDLNTYGYVSAVTTPEGVKLSEFDNGAYSGWMYFVNGGETGTGLSGYTVDPGDVIEFKYIDDYRTLYGYSLIIEKNVEDAAVKIFHNGEEVIDYGWGYSLMPGSYTYTAEKEGYITESGSFDIYDTDCTIIINLIKDTEALVNVVGDSVHAPGAHASNDIWASAVFAAEADTTAEKLILAALDNAGYKYNYSNGYLSSVTTPDGVELGSGTNGVYSGWMYKVNGSIPAVGMAEYSVKAGDKITLFYNDDYRELYGYGLTINKNLDEIDVHIYNEDGDEMLDYGWGYSLMPGTYTYAASLDSAAKVLYGSFDVYNEDAVLDIVIAKWGDYNLDGELDASDSAAILQKALVSTFAAPLDDIDYIDVDNDGDITANDSAEVLSKVLNGTFKMPCEKE